MQKKILLISRHAPYGNSTAREALDTALAASVYDQDISVLFMDDGIFQLLKNQHSQFINQKNIASTIPALSLYGIENIYAHQNSLTERAIGIEELILDDIKILSNDDVKILLTEQDHVLSF
ncbi:MAG: sulfurtransferase complex subunit TusC [Cellvibrio sp.]|uniref:sulfurtransferase complex subunit TusC n=1 Tax=Cellvibrio sp. TaxID=1965322 RepID=UPI0031A02FA1